MFYSGSVTKSKLNALRELYKNYCPKNNTKMKKYKVITDNLDWYNVPRGLILENIDGEKWFVNPNYAINNDTMDHLLKLHHDWFEEIKEEEEEKSDWSVRVNVNGNIKFCIVKDITKQEILDYFDKKLDIIDCLSGYQEYKPEEKFTKEDIIEFAFLCQNSKFTASKEVIKDFFEEWLK